MKNYLILLLTVIPLIGCSSGNVVQSPEGSWMMYRMSGVELNKDQLMKGLPVFHFDIKAERFSGHAGCNQLMSSIAVSANKITFARIIHTEMACPHMEVENAVLNALNESTVTFEIKDSVLTLTSADGTVMQFRKDQSY